MKRFEVTYTVQHTKEFWVKDEAQIYDILNEYNQCNVIKITEIPTDSEVFEGA